MNVAVAISMLLLGGLTGPNLASPVGPVGGTTYQPPDIAAFRAQAPPLQRSRWPNRGTGAPYRFPGSRYGRPGVPGSPADRARPGFDPAAAAGQAGLSQQLPPLAPTDPAAAAESFPFAPPTAGAGAMVPGAGVAGQLGGAYVFPERGRPAFTPSPTASVRKPAPARRSAPRTVTQGLAPKPFSDYRRPSGVSPYMNLFRSADSFGAIDKYSQWVRPRVEQQYYNQQVGRQISGLRGAGRLQGMDIRTLGRATQNLQGTAVRPRFMNYGGYYPGLQR